MCRRLSLLPFHVTMQITCAFLGSTECNRSLLSLTEYKKKILQKMQRWTPLYVLLTASSLFLLILSRVLGRTSGSVKWVLKLFTFIFALRKSFHCSVILFPLNTHTVHTFQKLSQVCSACSKAPNIQKHIKINTAYLSTGGGWRFISPQAYVISVCASARRQQSRQKEHPYVSVCVRIYRKYIKIRPAVVFSFSSLFLAHPLPICHSLIRNLILFKAKSAVFSEQGKLMSVRRVQKQTQMASSLCLSPRSKSEVPISQASRWHLTSSICWIVFTFKQCLQPVLRNIQSVTIWKKKKQVQEILKNNKIRK